MIVEPDFEDLLKSFNKHKVKYCLVGAFAVAYYGKPRYTKDMDLLVEPSIENGKKILSALKDFGFGSLNLNAKDFSEEKQIIQLGYEPIRIDLLTSIEGLSFNKVWKNKIKAKYGKTKINIIGRAELIKNKKLSNRPQDRADLETI